MRLLNLHSQPETIQLETSDSWREAQGFLCVNLAREELTMGIVIDGDGHIVEPTRIWSEYVDSKWKDQIFYAAESLKDGAQAAARAWPMKASGGDRSDLIERFVVDGFETHLTSPEMPFTVADTMHPRGILPGKRRYGPFSECHAGGFDSAERLAVHDAEGIDAAVLFPTLGLFIGSVRDAFLGEAMAQAVNRFAADFCAGAPKELYGVATLPWQDPRLAAKELRRCVEQYGFVAGWVRPNPTQGEGRTLDDASLDILWSTAEDLDVPICIHSGTTGREPTAGMDRAKTFLLAHAIAHPFEGMLAFGSMFQGRVFDRHPKLRVGYMESGCGWAPFWLDRLDEHCEIMGWMFDPPIRRKPSDIFRQQCVVGCESEEPMVSYVQHRLGNDRVLWASDFPHFDCEMPGLVTPMRERDDMSDQQREGALHLAASGFYRLDEDAIRRSVERRRGRANP